VPYHYAIAAGLGLTKLDKKDRWLISLLHHYRLVPGRGWIRTLDLRVHCRVLYHYASAAGLGLIKLYHLTHFHLFGYKTFYVSTETSHVL
jgi:hypothetical protein